MLCKTINKNINNKLNQDNKQNVEIQRGIYLRDGQNKIKIRLSFMRLIQAAKMRNYVG